MAKSRKSISYEEFLKTLRDQPPVETPNCLSPEEIGGLAEAGYKYPDAQRLFAHVVTCPFCRSQYRTGIEMIEAVQKDEAIKAINIPNQPASLIQTGVGQQTSTAARHIYKTTAQRTVTKRLRTVIALAAVALVAVILSLHIRPFQVKPGTRVQPKLIDAALIDALGLNGNADALTKLASMQIDNPVPLSGTRGNKLSSNVRLLRPVSTYVLDTHPNLQWVPASGATVNSVLVISDSSVWDSDALPKGSSWRVGRGLLPDHRYTWQVKVTKNGAEDSASALFYVPPMDVLTAMTRNVSSLTPLQRGVLYLEAGQWRESEQELATALSHEHNPRTHAALVQLIERVRRKARSNGEKVP